jgi:hypothetical protein
MYFVASLAVPGLIYDADNVVFIICYIIRANENIKSIKDSGRDLSF